MFLLLVITILKALDTIIIHTYNIAHQVRYNIIFRNYTEEIQK